MATPAQEKAVQRAISGIENSYKSHIGRLDFMYDSHLQWLQSAIRSAREKFALSSLLKISAPTEAEVCGNYACITHDSTGMKVDENYLFGSDQNQFLGYGC